jgi:hypothetical protein
MHSVVAAGDTPEQKARKIYAFVQGLQNLSYSPRRSEAEMKALGLKDARGVEDVLRQKMGDGEDLARLYMAMAREAGLSARMMRVASVNDNFFDEFNLDFGQLDHEIVLLKLASGEIQLDPGVRFCPFGLVYYRHADTRGLRQVEGHDKETEFAEVAGNSYKDAWMRREAVLTLREDGSVEGTVQASYRGQRALIFRLQHWRTDEAGKKKAMEDQMKHLLPENSEVELTNKPDWDSDQELVAEFKIVAPAGSSAGKRLLLPLDLFHYGDQPRFPHAERVYPIDFEFAFRSTDHIKLTLPASMQVEQMPEKVDERLTYALYRVATSTQPGHVEVLRDLQMAGVGFPVTEYQQLKGFFDKVKIGDHLQLVLKGASHASE